MHGDDQSYIFALAIRRAELQMSKLPHRDPCLQYIIELEAPNTLFNGLTASFHLAHSSTATATLFSTTYSHKMKEAIVSEGLKVQIVDSPIPTPEPDQVVIKVVVSGTNPKDWKMPLPQHKGRSFNPGDDIAGVVHSVGSNVVEFKQGDRVAAFHEISAPGGSYAEYAVSWDHTTFHTPKKTTFEGQHSSAVMPTHSILICTQRPLRSRYLR